MYKRQVYDFVHPFGGALNEANRWVKLAAATDWVGLEWQYAAHFHKGGAQALPVRMAFGSLVIRAALGLSDRQTVELIREEDVYKRQGWSWAKGCASFTRGWCLFL